MCSQSFAHFWSSERPEITNRVDTIMISLGNNPAWTLLDLKSEDSSVTAFTPFFPGALVPSKDFTSAIFFTNLCFIAPHPWQHLCIVSALLPSISLRGAVDCTVAHTAVIQCYCGGHNSVLCDQEPHCPGCRTLWQMIQVRRVIDESRREDLMSRSLLTSHQWVFSPIGLALSTCV